MGSAAGETAVIEEQALLEVRNLEVVRGGTRLLGVPAFQIQKGERLSLIGPNGAGKTTLLQALACLLFPFEGELLFRGLRVGKGISVLEYRRSIAMAFQEALLFDTTVFNNVASGLKMRGIGKEQIRMRVGEHLELFGIAHLKDRSARTLSGGEAQRTSLARAFAVDPVILFLDEPFASLDPPTRDSLLSDIEGILRRKNTTVVLATHDRQEALRFSSRVAVVRGGQICQTGPVDEVVNHPADEFIASFVGVETVLRGVVISFNGSGFVADVRGKRIEATGTVGDGEHVILCIRPENVTLTRTVTARTSARNQFTGRIVRISKLGPYNKVEVDAGFPLASYVTTHAVTELSLSEGSEVTASFKATAVQVIRRAEG
jgi:tungstate transport system ATP-binding protein